MAERMSVRGRVSRKVLDAGSKNEHEGMVLETDTGRSFVLRRGGGPSFGDQTLDPLVGHSIATDGVAQGNLFIMKAWESLD